MAIAPAISPYLSHPGISQRNLPNAVRYVDTQISFGEQQEIVSGRPCRFAVV
jgi:hypothetical protein